MALITMHAKGSFKRTGNFLEKMVKLDIRQFLEEYGKKGVESLAAHTPKRTGKTASMWRYDVDKTFGGWRIEWFNDNINDGVPIAIIIEYGHGTGWGGYVPPQPYITQALESIYDELADQVWKEVENG